MRAVLVGKIEEFKKRQSFFEARLACFKQLCSLSEGMRKYYKYYIDDAEKQLALAREEKNFYERCLIAWDKKRNEILRAKGLKAFCYNGENVVYAINQKNADKKAKKLGLI